MSRTNIHKQISRLMAVLLCLILILPVVPVARAAESGSCGDSLTWTLAGGTLTISGSGAMEDYSESSPAPWYASRSQIMSLSLSDGITYIGAWAFADCTNLTSVSIPGSVQTIGKSAFRRCTGMTMLTIHEGIESIGICAFDGCTALADLRLPESLVSLGDHAFYLCESLTYVTIPGGVRSMGSGVFAYCKNLIRVDVNAAVTMPSWTFYGCNELLVVSVNGTAVDPESLMVVTPPQVLPGFPGRPAEPAAPGVAEPPATYPTVTYPAVTEPVATEPPVAAPESGMATSEKLTTDSSGNPVTDTTTVTKTENSTITTNTQIPVGSTTSTGTGITSTVHNDKGWQEVVDKVNAETRGDSGTVDVTVYTPNSDTVGAGVLQQLAGKDVNLTVQTQSGSKFTLNCAKLENVKSDLVLSYTISPMEEVPEALAGCVVYQLKFHESSQALTEMIIRLPGEHALQTASLYQVIGRKEPKLLQSVMVDLGNNAHWYLRSIDKKTTYLIAINVPGITADTPIIPAELAGIYKVENVYDGVEYIVTGRTSSWNMGLGKVMGILAAVMISVIVVVGVVMFSLNKKRAASIYDENWDDDE